MRKAVLGLALGVAAALAAAVSTGAERNPAGPVYARAAASATASISSNWAGYVATGPGSTSTTAASTMAYTDVTAQWVQPAATCTPGASTSAALWVGLGGYSENSQELEQTGTSADCDSRGKATYYAWYELVPADSVNINLKIFPGDVITSSVFVNGSDVLVQVKNRTRKTAFTKHIQMADPDLTSAEWIAEAPALCGASGSCRELALTNFGSVTFTHAYAIGNKTNGRITSPAWMTTAIQLIPDANRVYGYNNSTPTASAAGALPTGLAADGSGFTVTWQPNPTPGQ